MTRQESLDLISSATLGGPGRVEDGDPLEAIAEDSLAFVWCLQEIEKEWGGRFDDNVIGGFKTVGDIADWMVAHC